MNNRCELQIILKGSGPQRFHYQSQSCSITLAATLGYVYYNDAQLPALEK